MSKRNPLRELSKRFPSPPELRQAFDALRHDTDRSVAIVAASIADNILERLLIRHMKAPSPDLLGLLFGMRGPLGDFHSKILVAEAFGVISSTMAKELNRVRAIRNVFAHAVTPVSFDTVEIAEEMRGFAMLNAMDGVDHKGPKFQNPRDKGGYLLVVQIICIMIDREHRERGGGPLLAGHEEVPTAPVGKPSSPPPGRKRPGLARPRAKRHAKSQ